MVCTKIIAQAQLYRLLEHFLRKANLSIIRRTAETELAVADAINIEKEVADKSNSKLVYVNLCSQELSRRSDNMNLSRDAETSPPTSGVSSDGEKVTNDSNLEVNEALKTAGLLSDTPPNSPSKPVEEIKEDAGFLNKSESDGPDNVFEMDSQPELDIYGDFDYDLEDDYFVGASALKISKLQQEVSKMKVLFSTLNPDASNGSQDICDHEGSAGVGPTMASSGHEFPTDAGNSTVDGRANDNQPQNTRVDEVYGELSLAECEELYGPDKEPLIEKYPETALVKPCELVAGKEIVMENGCHGSSEMAKTSESKSGNLAVSEAHQGSVGSVNSPSHSQNTEKVQRKEKMSTVDSNKLPDSRNFVSKKVLVTNAFVWWIFNSSTRLKSKNTKRLFCHHFTVCIVALYSLTASPVMSIHVLFSDKSTYIFLHRLRHISKSISGHCARAVLSLLNNTDGL